MRGLTIAILPAVFALAACGGQAPDRSEDAREAEGEVLGGSISDEMLPLDQLRSQSPVLRAARAEQEGEAGEEGEATGEDGAATGEPAPADGETPAG